MGVQPGHMSLKISNRKHIYDMDNEINKRLHDVDTTMYSINISNDENCNCTFKINNNNINRRILTKSEQQHYQHQYYNYNFKNRNHLTILKILLSTFLIFMLRTTTTINCLPVTSKPIENTPEHLAWEAWIMLPPPANSERHRKIMPKSIFVLPTRISNTNRDNLLPVPQSQVQCPPGHRVDNSKCIPTISFDRDQLLLDQLSNLLPISKPDDSNYDDYDYDYTNGETINYDLNMLQKFHQQQLPPLINQNPNSFRETEKNSEPLKINFSLDKFTIAKDDDNNKSATTLDVKKTPNEFLMEVSDENSNEEIKLQPFRDQEASSTHIELSTAEIKDENKPVQSESFHSTEISTTETGTKTKDATNVTEPNQTKQITTNDSHYNQSTTNESTNTERSENLSQPNHSNTNTNTIQFDKKSESESKREPMVSTTEISDTRNDNNGSTSESNSSLESSYSNEDFEIFITTLSATDSTTLVPILSSDENEMSTLIETEDDFNATTTTPDYEYDQMTTGNKDYQENDDNASNNNQNFELVTEKMDKDKNIEEKLSEESFVIDLKTIEENSSQNPYSVNSFQDDITTNIPNYDDVSTDKFDQLSSTNKILKSTTNSFPFTSSTTTEEPQISSTNKNGIKQKFQHEIVHVANHRHHHKHYNKLPATVSISSSQPIEWHEDREPLMESIESNNRFVYHHLGSSIEPQTEHSSISHKNFNTVEHLSTTTTKTPTPIKRDSEADINEQLRIINMIVEENKRRAQASKVRFPDREDETISSNTDLRSSTNVRFPMVKDQMSTPYQIESSSHYQPQSSRFDPEKLIFHRRFFQQQHSTTPSPPKLSSTATTTTLNTQKPFWWLPSGWEIDESGDRPMLIRFWSRSPSRNSEQFGSNTESYTDQYRTSATKTHHIPDDFNKNYSNNFNIYTSDGSPTQQLKTTTTSRYRENSRSPTDSLYSEIPSSQNVYKVLNAARQWKHSKR